MKTFYAVVANTLGALITNFFVWFALTFWLYIETKSVLATSLVGGGFMLAMAFSGFWFGAIVDHHKKKSAMLLSSFATLGLYGVALAVYLLAPQGSFEAFASPLLWLLIFLTLAAVIAGNIRTIALPTVVTLLVPEGDRARANGISGMAMGGASLGAGVSSGFVLAYAGMGWVLAIGILCTVLAIAHLAWLTIPEADIVHSEDKPREIDIRGTIAVMSAIPGLFALVFFSTFNNFLAGVFIALMDAYSLTLMPVQVWGTLWGVLSLGFIVGGFLIAKRGLGADPLRTLFIVNGIIWTGCIFFTIQPSILLLCAGTLLWVCLSPYIEATEQTIIQKLVPLERQGRVFGFAQSIETGASPITAFLVGPLAQFIFIPFMTTGAGVDLIGGWFGTGPGRGMALVFMIAGTAGLCVTLIAMRSPSYRLLAERYHAAKPAPGA